VGDQLPDLPAGVRHRTQPYPDAARLRLVGDVVQGPLAAVGHAHRRAVGGRGDGGGRVRAGTAEHDRYGGPLHGLADHVVHHAQAQRIADLQVGHVDQQRLGLGGQSSRHGVP
jgi:hypothetical protein